MVYLYIVFILTTGGELRPVEALPDVQACEIVAQHYNRVEYFKSLGRFFCMATTNDNGGLND